MQDQQLRRIRVLLVDDNEHTLVLVRRILRGFGIRQVATAENALGALKQLRENPIDIMITDLVMDPVDGLTLVEMIRGADDSPNRNLPIIMLTGYPEAENEEAAQKAGVDAFLAKPVSPQLLHQHICKAMAARRRPRAATPG